MTTCDIIVPCYNEQEVLPITAPMFLDKIKGLAAAGKINSKKFHGWSTGEVLFVKASLSPSYTNAKGHKLVDIKYVFRIRPLGAVVRNQLKIEPVSMWNTVWDIPRRNVQNSLMSVGIYESRIYDYANFSVLDI